MRLNNIQSNMILQYTRGVALREFVIVGDKIHYIFEDGKVLKSRPFTKDRLEWIRLQVGTEPDFLRLVYEILLEMIKK